MFKRMSYGKIYRPNVLFVRTSTRVPIYPADAILPADGFYRPRGCILSFPPSRPSPAPCGRSLLSARTGYICVHADTRIFYIIYLSYINK
jgi:hypothetical protein